MNLKIINPEKEVKLALKLLDKCKKINVFNFNLSVCFDYELPWCGMFETEDPLKIKINPNQCNLYKDKKLNAFGYTNDFSITGVIIHEFCHFLSMKYFKGFIDDFCDTFKKRLIISLYHESKVDRDEEIAELMLLYMTNPYFLNHISREHYLYFKKIFKSPTPCTELAFKKIAWNWNDEIKGRVEKKWGLK